MTVKSMILTTHALAGAVIGKNIDNPALVIAISLVIHFMMDSLRHGEYFDSRVATVRDTRWRVVLDLAVGFSLILSAILFNFSSLSEKTIVNIAIGVFFSMFPDGLTLLFWKYNFKWLEKIKEFHSWAHRYNRYPKYSPERQWTLRNALNDIIISIAATFLLFLL